MSYCWLQMGCPKCLKNWDGQEEDECPYCEEKAETIGFFDSKYDLESEYEIAINNWIAEKIKEKLEQRNKMKKIINKIINDGE